MRGALAVLLSTGLVCLAGPAEKKLTIVRTAFAQIEDGPSVGSDFQFLPGDTIYFSCQTEGYKKVNQDYDKFRVYLTYQIEVSDSHGVPLRPLKEGDIQTILSPEDKDWMPKVRETITVPPLAQSGEYQVTVTMKDQLATATTVAHAVFLVKGHDVAPSDTLVVRNFHFLRGEDDDKPLQVAAYRPGDSVWARFDMTGYKLGEENAFDIQYGLQVLRADGSVAYSQPNAASEQDQSFYPQRYQPGVLSLDLAKDQPLGEYTIVLTVRDNLGNQTYETREKFSVE
jgi:hypothetical protein